MAGISICRRRSRDEEAKKQPAKKKPKQSSEVLGTKYFPREVLGNGSYGVVWSCLDIDTKEAVAVKKIADPLSNRTTAVRTLREIQILRRIGRHDNVISLKDVMLSGPSTVDNVLLPCLSSSSPAWLRANFRHVYLVQELMDYDLGRFIRSSSSSPAGLSGHHVKLFLFQFLRGLKFLHSANIIHRDLKPQNILINKNCDLKICDFGLARTNHDQNPQNLTEYVVTRWYRAPELLTGSSRYGNGVDVWSAGCILAEMLGGKPIFPGENSLNQISKIYSFLGTQSDLSFVESPRSRNYLAALPYSAGIRFEKLFPSADPLVIDLLKKMLVLNPSDRISASQALEHPYFWGIYDPVRDGNNSAPVSKVSLEIDEEKNPEGLDWKVFRDMMWKEMLFYHPELTLPDPSPVMSTRQAVVIQPAPACHLSRQCLDRSSRRRRIVL